MNQDVPVRLPDLESEQERAAIVTRYKPLRSAGIQLNHKIMPRLSHDVISEGGEKLGLIQNGGLLLQSPDQSNVLMDYCIFDVYRQGRNAVTQYLLDSPPPGNSTEGMYLQAMENALYTLCLVERVISGVGLLAQDVLTNERILVADIGLGQSGVPGLLLATRILPHENFWMTGGAALPMGVLPETDRDDILHELLSGLPPYDPDEFDPAPLIRSCLASGSSSRIEYQEPVGRPSLQQKSPRLKPDVKPGRNKPCPCGSGKKSKHCCYKSKKRHRL